MERLTTRPIICLITDRTLVGAGNLEAAVGEAIAGGINLVQLREKDLSTRALLDLARALRRAIGAQIPLVVNGRADVAFAAEADGVHLPANGLPPAGARAALREGALVGLSVHSATEACRNATAAIDYVELGTIFPSRSHPGGQTIGLAAIRAARNCGLPIVAVGGITPQNAAEVIAAGADGVAVISAILGQADPRSAAARLSESVFAGWAQRQPPAALPTWSRSR